jgi:hypothetical protein
MRWMGLLKWYQFPNIWSKVTLIVNKRKRARRSPPPAPPAACLPLRALQVNPTFLREGSTANFRNHCFTRYNNKAGDNLGDLDVDGRLTINCMSDSVLWTFELHSCKRVLSYIDRFIASGFILNREVHMFIFTVPWHSLQTQSETSEDRQVDTDP